MCYNLVTNNPCHDLDFQYNVTLRPVTLTLTIEVVTLTPVTEVNRLHKTTP